jgi:hypothetical protein
MQRRVSKKISRIPSAFDNKVKEEIKTGPTFNKNLDAKAPELS